MSGKKSSDDVGSFRQSWSVTSASSSVETWLQLVLQYFWRAESCLQVFGHVHLGYGSALLGFNGTQHAFQEVDMYERYSKLSSLRSWFRNMLKEHIFWPCICPKIQS